MESKGFIFELEFEEHQIQEQEKDEHDFPEIEPSAKDIAELEKNNGYFDLDTEEDD